MHHLRKLPTPIAPRETVRGGPYDGASETGNHVNRQLIPPVMRRRGMPAAAEGAKRRACSRRWVLALAMTAPRDRG
jgi:hypothetical protein